jgi:hypothetical protein
VGQRRQLLWQESDIQQNKLLLNCVRWRYFSVKGKPISLEFDDVPPGVSPHASTMKSQPGHLFDLSQEKPIAFQSLCCNRATRMLTNINDPKHPLSIRSLDAGCQPSAQSGNCPYTHPYFGCPVLFTAKFPQARFLPPPLQQLGTPGPRISHLLSVLCRPSSVVCRPIILSSSDRVYFLLKNTPPTC